ncbi:MAG: DUF983 domain-containing protein [Pseudomonadota bacterium]
MPVVIDEPAEERRSRRRAMARGFAGRCPKCGEKTLFAHYTKTAEACPNCGEAFHHHRADDAPPYFTIFVVGHVVGPLALLLEQLARPPLWVHWAIWIPAVIAASLYLLPKIKGLIVGLQWALKMHGFGGEEPPVPAQTPGLP